MCIETLSFGRVFRVMPGPGQLKGMEVRPFDQLVDALEMSRASGIPIEKFASGMIDPEPSKQTR